MLVSNLDRYAMKSKPKYRPPISPVEEHRQQTILNASDDDLSVGSNSSSSSTRSTKGRRRRKKGTRGRRSRSFDSQSSSSSQRSDGRSRDAVRRRRRQADIKENTVVGGVDFRKKLHRRMQMQAQHTTNGVNPETGGQARTRALPPTDGAYSVVFGQCFAGNHYLSHRSRMAQLEAYTNVLELRMEAKLVDYYRNHYLRLFPDSPTSNGVSPFLRTTVAPKRPDSTPTLASISSDASSASPDRSVVDFFAGVPSSPVNLAVDDSAFLDMAVTGSLGLVDRKRGRDSPTSSLLKQQKSPEHYIVLMHRRSGIPLAMCALKSPKGPPVVRIYTTKPRVFGQRSAATTDELGIKWASALPLFAWAEIVANGEFPMLLQYSIYMATGSDGRFEKVPSYQASHASTGLPDISIVGKTESEKEYKGCASISVRRAAPDSDDIVLALSVSRGIDPALIICLAAVTDEIMEKYMRQQCELYQKTELRRGLYYERERV